MKSPITLIVTMLVLTLTLASCTFYPRKVVYDTGCGVTTAKFVLEAEPLTGGCYTSQSDPAGGACLAGMASWSILSAIVSGTIVAVGNTVYWIGENGKCSAKHIS